MEFLPQKEATGTKALCALFESKATLQQCFSSSPRLNMASETDSVTVRDYPLQDRRSHNTFLKDTAASCLLEQLQVVLQYSAGHPNDTST